MKAITIIPLGVPRSGTSMIAGVLRCLGVDMGDNINPDKHEDLNLLYKSPSEMINVIKKYNETKKNWGFKTPLIGKTINDIHPYLRNPIFILIKRNQEDTIQSDLKHNPNALYNYAKERNELLMKSILYYLKRYNVKPLKINYEVMIKHPKEHVNKIIDFLGIKITEEQRQNAIRFIQPGGYREL